MSIDIRHMVHVYATRAGAVTALHDVNLEVAEGEVCILRGPNGSGKTTLISILSGSLTPTAGSVTLARQAEVSPKIAVVRQFDNLLPELTVREHFTLFSRAGGLEAVPEDLHDQRVVDITHAQRQIVAIALALSSEPDLLLADEPTGALSATDALTVYDRLNDEVRARGITLLLVTHDARAERIADRVVRLQEGRVSEAWRPGEAPRQIVDADGWLRVPDDIRGTLGRQVTVQSTPDGAALLGTRSEPKASPDDPAPRRVSAHGHLEVQSLGFRHGAQAVLTGVTAQVSQGSITSVIGAPGSGKSTLLRLIAGLAAPTEGSVTWHRAPEQVPAAYFSADMPFATHLSLDELNVSASVLTSLGLAHVQQRELRTLSGGQRQRAIVALAISHPSSCILLDDPTASLDESSTARVLDAIRHTTKTVLIATHDPRVVAIADATIDLSR